MASYNYESYKQQAQQQYDPAYNAKVQALKNQLAQNTQALEQQKRGINSNYDLQVQNQNLNNKLNKNNVSNAMLGRGLSNSSIAVSGLAEQDAKNTRLVGNINRERTGALNDIDAQKALLAQNMNNTLAQMAGDRETEIMALARKLYGEDWDRGYKDRTLAQQRELQQAQLAYQYSQLAQQRELQNAQMAFEREKYEAQNRPDISKYTDAFGSIIGNNELSVDDKHTALKGLYKQAELYNKSTGADVQSLLDEIYGWGKANPTLSDAAKRNLAKSGR